MMLATLKIPLINSLNVCTCLIVKLKWSLYFCLN